MSYLTDDWLGQGWVQVSKALQNAIVGRVWEIYANAFEHSNSPIGVFSCGQYYPTLEVLKLTAIDFGVGIPANVREFKGNPLIAASSAIKWAFQFGTTTKPNGVGRGVGLDLLRDFVRVNRGHLEVFSGNGYASISRKEETFVDRKLSFQGTLVNITFQCDESRYILSSERDETKPLF